MTPNEAAARALVEAQLGHPEDGHMKPELWQKRLPCVQVAVIAWLEAALERESGITATRAIILRLLKEARGDE